MWWHQDILETNMKLLLIIHLKHILNKTDAERRQTLGHPRSINSNMINHVPQQLPIIF